MRVRPLGSFASPSFQFSFTWRCSANLLSVRPPLLPPCAPDVVVARVVWWWWYTTLHWASLQFFGDSAFSLVTTTVPLRRKRSHFSASARFYSLSSFCCELIFSELILLLLLRFPFPLFSTDARTHTFDRSFVRSFVMT